MADDYAHDNWSWNVYGEDKQPFASEGKNHSKLDWSMKKSSSTVSQQVTLHKNEAVSMHDNREGEDYKRKGVMDGSWTLKHANREKAVAKL